MTFSGGDPVRRLRRAGNLAAPARLPVQGGSGRWQSARNRCVIVVAAAFALGLAACPAPAGAQALFANAHAGFTAAQAARGTRTAKIEPPADALICEPRAPRTATWDALWAGHERARRTVPSTGP